MQNLEFAAESAWRVLVASLILGAGLPALFGLAVRALAYGAGGDAELHETGVAGPAPHRVGTVVAWVLFATVLLGVALGIAFIVVSGLGKTLSFEHVFPTIVDK
jgi:hypothetical protein